MAELMLMAIDKTNTDPTLDAGCAKKGDIIQIFPDGSFREAFAPIGPSQPYVGLKIPGFEIDEVYGREWHRIVDWKILSSVALTDTHQIRLFAVPGEYSPTSGIGKITRTMAEAYLNKWGAAVLDFSDNSVTFEAQVAKAIQSEGFWGQDVSKITFTETNYNASNGNHATAANYSATNIPSAVIAEIVAEIGATITAHNTTTKVITFRINRSLVTDRFKDDLKQRLKTMLRKRKYHISDVALDVIAATEDRIGTMTEVQFGDAIRNKAN
jgi:hypothetical protein